MLCKLPHGVVVGSSAWDIVNAVEVTSGKGNRGTTETFVVYFIHICTIFFTSMYFISI